MWFTPLLANSIACDVFGKIRHEHLFFLEDGGPISGNTTR